MSKAGKEDAAKVADAAAMWGRNFLACGTAGLRGFMPKNLTPYAHIVKDHVPHMISKLGGLGRFSGERLEKLNDEFKQTFHRFGLQLNMERHGRNLGPIC